MYILLYIYYNVPHNFSLLFWLIQLYFWTTWNLAKEKLWNLSSRSFMSPWNAWKISERSCGHVKNTPGNFRRTFWLIAKWWSFFSLVQAVEPIWVLNLLGFHHTIDAIGNMACLLWCYPWGQKGLWPATIIVSLKRNGKMRSRKRLRSWMHLSPNSRSIGGLVVR